MSSLTERIALRAREARIQASSREGRRSLRRQYLFETLRTVVPVVAVDTPDGRILVSTSDRTVGRHVFMDGGWDAEGLARALGVAAMHGHSGLSGRTFVEVGANIGTTTLQAARRAARVIAIEPEPGNLALLRANMALNELDHVTVIAAAASHTAGSGRLALSMKNHGDHRVARHGEVDVALVRLDDVLQANGISARDVGLLWLDTQGHEASVLDGAINLISDPPFAVVEYWPSVLRQNGTLDHMNGLLTAWSAIVDLGTRDAQPEPISTILDRHEYDHTDLLLIP